MTKAKRKESRKRVKTFQKQESLASGKEEIVNAVYMAYTDQAKKRVEHYITELDANKHLESNPYASIDTNYRPINVKNFDKLTANMQLREIGKQSRHTDTFIDKTSAVEIDRLERNISLYKLRLETAIVGKMVLQDMLKTAEQQSPILAQRYLELKNEAHEAEIAKAHRKSQAATHFSRKPKETKDEKRSRLLAELAALDIA